MKTKSILGENYTGLVLDRAGMMGPERAQAARIEIEFLIRTAKDGDLKEALAVLQEPPHEVAQTSMPNIVTA